MGDVWCLCLVASVVIEDIRVMNLNQLIYHCEDSAQSFPAGIKLACVLLCVRELLPAPSFPLRQCAVRSPAMCVYC
jgi:hypothetical protein